MESAETAALPAATYVNFLQVAHGQAEFFLAFGELAQSRATRAAHLASRLVASPLHARAMLAALAEAVERYEARFGEIPELERGVPPASEADSEREEPSARRVARARPQRRR